MRLVPQKESYYILPIPLLSETLTPLKGLRIL